MDFFKRRARKRYLLEGSEVVEERIRRRLEELQAKLEERLGAQPIKRLVILGVISAELLARLAVVLVEVNAGRRVIAAR